MAKDPGAGQLKPLNDARQANLTGIFFNAQLSGVEITEDGVRTNKKRRIAGGVIGRGTIIGREAMLKELGLIIQP